MTETLLDPSMPIFGWNELGPGVCEFALCARDRPQLQHSGAQLPQAKLQQGFTNLHPKIWAREMEEFEEEEARFGASTTLAHLGIS
jgi:hypothetical protein